MDEVPRRSHQHIAFPSEADFNDMTPCECLTATVDLFFDALTKIKQTNSVKVVDYITQKVSQHLIHQNLTTTRSVDAQIKPTSSRIKWINLLRGFSSSIQPEDQSPRTLCLLVLVDILNNVDMCLLGEYDHETFKLLVQLFISLSQFPELQDAESQQMILELHQEANTQDMIYQYMSSGNRSSNVERLHKAHPMTEFFKKVKLFVSSVIKDKFKNLAIANEQEQLGCTLLKQEHACDGDILTPQGLEQMDLSVNQSPEPNEHDLEPLEVKEPGQDATVVSSMKGKVPPTVSPPPTHYPANCCEKSPQRWSSVEEENLIEGVRRFGVKSWQKIYNTYQFDGRSLSHLKMKWLQIKDKKGAGCSRTSAYMSKRMMTSTLPKQRPIVNDRQSSPPQVPSSSLELNVDLQSLNVGTKRNSRSRAAKDKFLQELVSRPKKLYVRWTKEETEYLKKGVSTFGVGNWSKILDTYPFHSSRNGKGLQNRWNLLQFQCSVEQ